MATVALGRARLGERGNPLLVALAAAHACLLLALPSPLVVALGLWWNANTVAHNFIHRPFFHSRAQNAFFSLFLTLLLGFPQSLWRRRHLAHHAGRRPDARWDAELVAETALLAALALALVLVAPAFLVGAYAPGYSLGLGLCWLQGHYEHVNGTASHYGRLYNLLFFNDGYHVEHHAFPSARWSELPGHVSRGARASRWPAVLRWLDALSLEGLERQVIPSPRLRRFVLACHARAFRRLLPGLAGIRHVKIVGGGLFPRTALILREVLPGARLTIIDHSAENLASARRFLDGDVGFVLRSYEPPPSEDADLVVVPLAYVGDRRAFYRHPPSPVVVHDWIWRRRGSSAVVSWLLLKRLNLIRP